MQTEGYGQSVQTFVRAYLVALFLSLIATGIYMINAGGRDWGYGDWLINYQGGFIRRGFMGEVSFLLAKPLHMDPIYFVALNWNDLLSLFIIFWRVWRATAYFQLAVVGHRAFDLARYAGIPRNISHQLSQGNPLLLRCWGR